MQLHKDGLISLEYDVVGDVLKVKWPDLSGITLPEINYSIQKMIDTLRHYDIKNLLIDSSLSQLTDVSTEDHQDMLVDLVVYLKTTRIRKLARIQTLDNTRESVVDSVADEAVNRIGIDFEFRNFVNEQLAYNWLKQE